MLFQNPPRPQGQRYKAGGWAHDAETQWWFLSCSGQRRELFLGAGAEVFGNHFSMRIGSCLPGWDVMSARVSENSGDSGRKSLANEIGLGRAQCQRARCHSAGSFKGKF